MNQIFNRLAGLGPGRSVKVKKVRPYTLIIEGDQVIDSCTGKLDFDSSLVSRRADCLNIVHKNGRVTVIRRTT